MKDQQKINLYSLFFLIFTVLIVAARFLWLDKVPPGLQHDEVEYAVNSKAYQLTGKDLSGVGFPQSLFYTATHGRISPIPPLLISPLWHVVPLNMTSIRASYVGINILSGIAFSLLLYSLFKDRKLSMLGGLLFLINPWSSFLSRQAIDAVFSLLFYMLGMAFLLRKSKLALGVSLLFFLLGFFSYHGAKLLLPPIVFLTLIFKWYNDNSRRNIIYYGAYAGVILLSFLAFLFAGKLLPGSIFENRSEEVVFFNKEYLSKGVDLLRKDSIQSPLNSLFLNKVTVGLTYAARNYFTAFSPLILFFTGEVLRNHGLFFLIDLPLMIWGCLFLYSHHKRIFLYLMGIVAVAPLATALSMNGQTLLNRSFLLLPMFLIFVSVGLIQCFRYTSRYVHRSIVFVVIFGVYMVSYANFIFIYFIQIPIHEHSFYQTSTRVLANYIYFEKDKSKSIEVISKEPRQILLETLLFSPTAKQEQLLKRGETWISKDKYSIDTVSFVSNCPKIISKSTVYVVEKDRVDCMKGMLEDYIIINQLDAGVEYYIVNGKTCNDQVLTRWRSPHLFSDYSIEKLSENTFCERWISKP